MLNKLILYTVLFVCVFGLSAETGKKKLFLFKSSPLDFTRFGSMTIIDKFWLIFFVR